MATIKRTRLDRLSPLPTRSTAVVQRSVAPLFAALRIAALERHVMGFLALVDLGALFWCRPGSVVRHLGATPVARFATSCAERGCIFDAACRHEAGFGARLALAWCTQLRTLHVDDNDMRASDLCRLVLQNRATLRRIDAVRAWHDVDLVWAATHCAHLEALAAGAYRAHRAALRAVIALNACVREFALYDSRPSGDLGSSALRTVLESAWQLTRFEAPAYTLTVRQLRALVCRFPRLSRLVCEVALRESGDDHSLASTELALALSCFSSEPLTHLTAVFVPHRVTGSGDREPPEEDVGADVDGRLSLPGRTEAGSGGGDDDGEDEQRETKAKKDVGFRERCGQAEDANFEAADREESDDDDEKTEPPIRWYMPLLVHLGLTMWLTRLDAEPPLRSVAPVAPRLERYRGAQQMPLEFACGVLAHSPRLVELRQSAPSSRLGGRHESEFEFDEAGALNVRKLRTVRRFERQLARSAGSLRRIRVDSDWYLSASALARICESGRWPLLERLSVSAACGLAPAVYVAAARAILRSCREIRVLELASAHAVTAADSYSGAIRFNDRCTVACARGDIRGAEMSRLLCRHSESSSSSSSSARQSRGEIKVNQDIGVSGGGDDPLPAPMLRRLALPYADEKLWRELAAPRLAEPPALAYCDHDVTEMLRACGQVQARDPATASYGDSHRWNVRLEPGGRLSAPTDDDDGLLHRVTRLAVVIAPVLSAPKRDDAAAADATNRALLDAFQALFGWFPAVHTLVLDVRDGGNRECRVFSRALAALAAQPPLKLSTLELSVTVGSWPETVAFRSQCPTIRVSFR